MLKNTVNFKASSALAIFISPKPQNPKTPKPLYANKYNIE